MALLGACTADSDTALAPPLVPAGGTGEVARAALRPSNACETAPDRVRTVLLDSFDKIEAMNRAVVPLPGEPVPFSDSGAPAQSVTGVEVTGLSGTSAGVAASAVAGSADSGTGGVVIAGSNDQEAGVAEGNTTVTDGSHLFTTVQTLAGRELRVVSLEGPPRVVGSVPLPMGPDVSSGLAGVTWATTPPQLLLRGEELLAVSTGGTGVPQSSGSALEPTPVVEPWTSQPTTNIALVDVSDPAAPRVGSTTTLEGWAVAIRMVDDVPRVVLTTTPDVVAQAGNKIYTDPAGVRAQIESISGDQVLPRRVATDGSVEPLVGCDQVLATPDAAASVDDPNVVVSSPELLSVVSIGTGLDDLSTTTVQGGSGLGTAVYASPAAVYLTSGVGTWDAPTSAIHRIELTDDGSRYTGSGTVPGEVLDQYSLSERNGDLRVVTTTDDGTTVTPLPEPMPLPVPATEGRLTVLRPGPDGVLTEIGHVDDLGVGERVQSVRFTDDTAYVVTFRQVDPLFAIDVSDPTAPRVLGELKIPGFSEYLHPLGNGLLLGVGVDADDQGASTGAKVSLFDVSDPAAPVETAVLRFPHSSAELWTALAFTWDPVRRTASFPLYRSVVGQIDCTTVPVEATGTVEDDASIATWPQTCTFRPDPGGPDGSRRVFVRVADDRLELAREFAPDANGDRVSDESMTRTVVVDDRIHGVTDSAVWTFDAELRDPEVRTPL
jgi:hypothetical protein